MVRAFRTECAGGEFNPFGKPFANAGFAALGLANCGAGPEATIARRCRCHGCARLQLTHARPTSWTPAWPRGTDGVSTDRAAAPPGNRGSAADRARQEVACHAPPEILI